jgi:hypothetical protein
MISAHVVNFSAASGFVDKVSRAALRNAITACAGLSRAATSASDTRANSEGLNSASALRMAVIGSVVMGRDYTVSSAARDWMDGTPRIARFLRAKCPSRLTSQELPCMANRDLSLRRSAEPVQVCSGKSGQSCYPTQDLESGRQEIAGDSV